MEHMLGALALKWHIGVTAYKVIGSGTHVLQCKFSTCVTPTEKHGCGVLT